MSGCPVIQRSDCFGVDKICFLPVCRRWVKGPDAIFLSPSMESHFTNGGFESCRTYVSHLLNLPAALVQLSVSLCNSSFKNLEGKKR